MKTLFNLFFLLLVLLSHNATSQVVLSGTISDEKEIPIPDKLREQLLAGHKQDIVLTSKALNSVTQSNSSSMQGSAYVFTAAQPVLVRSI